ncbi:MAG TPA: TIGR03435 family protein [Verrucomicrobiae bacterium]|nr:TIGR03435 family protein [Verrucomicrobiae bacterium]
MAWTNQPFETLIARAYGVSPWYVTAVTPLPKGEFDYMATTSQQPRDSLQAMIRSKYGLVGLRKTRETDVLLLTVRRPNASGLKPNFTGGIETSTAKTGSLSRVNGPIRSLAFDLENCLQIPVIDQTGLTGRFNYDLEWDDQLEWDNDTGRNHISNPEGLKQALLDQLGLELVPTNMPIEMLVVEKAK